MSDVQNILRNNGLDELEALYQAVLEMVVEHENEAQDSTFYGRPDSYWSNSSVALITALNHCEAVLLDFDDKVDGFYHIQGTPAELSEKCGLGG